MPLAPTDPFPFTPGFIHGETFTHAVQVNLFRDGTEQRFRLARDKGLRISYEFPDVSSQTLLGVQSFFQAAVGPDARFTVRDHRTATDHVARFADATLEHSRGPHIRRSLRLDFITDVGGATPISTTFVASTPPNFCEDVVPGSGVIPPSTMSTTSGYDGVLMSGFRILDSTVPYEYLSLAFMSPAKDTSFGSNVYRDVAIPMPENVRFKRLTAYVSDPGGIFVVTITNSGVIQPGLSLTCNGAGVFNATGSVVTSKGDAVGLHVNFTSGTSATATFGVGYAA